MRRTLAACVLVFALVCTGCVSGPWEPGTPTAGPVQTAAPDAPVAYEAIVFDRAIGDDPVLEGGLTGSDGPETTYAVTLLAETADAERIDRGALPPDARAFLDRTDFTTHSLVVIQATPKSTVPDYRVESVTRQNGGLDVRINDSGPSGTDDLTVETMLLRVPTDRRPLDHVAVSTQTGADFDTRFDRFSYLLDSTVEGVTLPYRSADPAANADRPRGISLQNTRTEPVDYELSVAAPASPDCTDTPPDCGPSAENVTILSLNGTLAPAEKLYIEDLAAAVGTYRVELRAEITEDGEERIVTDSLDWRVGGPYLGALVWFDESGVLPLGQTVE